MKDLETDLKNQGSFLGLLISRTCECYFNHVKNFCSLQLEA